MNIFARWLNFVKQQPLLSRIFQFWAALTAVRSCGRIYDISLYG